MNPVGLAGTGLRSDIVAHLLERSDTDVALWAPDGDVPENFPEGTEAVPIEELAETPLIFVCLPMYRLRGAIRELGDVLTGRHALVHTTRTLTPEDLQPISAVFEQETPTRRFGFLTGPMRRDDILENRGGSALCATPFPEIWEMVDEVLDVPRFRVYRSDDLRGSEASAAYARVIAMGYGICTAMGLGDSILSTLFARGLDETARFVVERGGGETTTFGLAGAGNLHADTTGDGHTDFRIGRRLVEADPAELESFRQELDPIEDELFTFLEALLEHAREAAPEYRILRALEQTVFGDRSFEAAFEDLMEQPSRPE